MNNKINQNRPRILLVANVAKEHIRKFHIPSIEKLVTDGWIVDVACKMDVNIPEATHSYAMCWERNPFTFKTLYGIRDLKKLIAKNNYDIVYCHTPVGGLVARIAARKFRKTGTKVVYCAHGLHFYKGAPLLNWLLYYPIEKLMSYLTDMFITINQEDCNRVRNTFNKRMSVKMINGIGVNFKRLNLENVQNIRCEYRASLGIPEDAIILIYVAEIIRNKNQAMLINTLNQLRKHGRNCWLLLVGPDHQHNTCQRFAESLNLSEYVKFLGWRSDIGALLASSDIYVASSIREGFGVNLVEAQYIHLPVVASSNRGHRAIIKDGENGFLVPVNDYSIMTSRIEKLIDDKELYQKMSNIDVSSYSSEKIADKIESYLNEVLSE